MSVPQTSIGAAYLSEDGKQIPLGMSGFNLKGLTLKQKDLMDYIVKRVSKRGISPSYDEMRKEMGLASKSGIHRLVEALEERGCLVRDKNRARSIYPTSNYVTANYSLELVELIFKHGVDGSIKRLRVKGLPKPVDKRSVRANVSLVFVHPPKHNECINSILSDYKKVVRVSCVNERYVDGLTSTLEAKTMDDLLEFVFQYEVDKQKK